MGREPMQSIYQQVPLGFNPAEGLRDHLDCASDSGHLSANSCPSFFESCSQGQLNDISGPPCGYAVNAQVAKESQGKEGQVRSVQICLAGVCGDVTGPKEVGQVSTIPATCTEY